MPKSVRAAYSEFLFDKVFLNLLLFSIIVVCCSSKLASWACSVTTQLILDMQ